MLSKEKVKPPKSSRPTDLAKQFRSVVDALQLDARTSQEDIATTLKNLDIELKGVIVVEGNEVRVVTPTLERPIDPNQLSTIRMSFSTIPVLRTTEKKSETQ